MPTVIARTTSPWSDTAPIRAELFSLERLEQHAISLATAQAVTVKPPRVVPLHRRLKDNAAALDAAYHASVVELESGRTLVPAAEWLLDNYYLVQEQIREVRTQLPIGFYRQLPKIEHGPLAGYPRIFGLAWAFVAHTDSHFDRDFLERFVAAYQRVEGLTIGELWAIPITLRIVLIENLRRLADQISVARGQQEGAIALSVRLLESDDAKVAFEAEATARSMGLLSEIFVAQLAKSLRDRDPAVTPTLGWLESRLVEQGTSISEVVQDVQMQQAATNVTIRNVITSMRAISNTAWADVFERISLVDACLREQSAFASMDFATRNRYRSVVEQLARGSAHSEVEVAKRALRASQASAATAKDPVEASRTGDPGYFLIAEGRPALEEAIGFVPPLSMRFARFNIGLGIRGHLSMMFVFTGLSLAAMFAAVAVDAPSQAWLIGFIVLALLPASELAVALANRLVTETIGAVPLPSLDLQRGVPANLRTLVVVPTLLVGESEIREQVERLEVHHLSGSGGDLYFALLSDWPDADSESTDGDAALLSVAQEAIAELNRRHAPGAQGLRFLLFHRRRVYSNSERCWMGWERKRGKLQELNRLLRGATDTTFVAVAEDLSRPPSEVRYVITLDADTRLPRDAAMRLVGKMGHPLNHPIFDRASGRVVAGYAILQPRVTPSLPLGDRGSIFLRTYAGDAGMDPYAAAASDVYQDLFGEGSFTGKGIYDIDAFEAAMAGRVPDGALLSHDLFEGTFARAGLASDIEVVEDFPSRYDVASKRQHRWTRGDWQLLPWIVGHWRGRGETPTIGRVKMIDNLRRSLVPVAMVAALVWCWLLPPSAAWAAQTVVLAAIFVPAFLPIFLGVFVPRKGVMLRSHARAVAKDVRLATIWTAMTIAFLADRAWSSADAVVRTLVRVFVTRRHLLQWTTAAQSARRRLPDIAGSYRDMAGGVAAVVVAAIVARTVEGAAWTAILPLAVLWFLAPSIALLTSRPLAPPPEQELDEDRRREARLIARRTWRYFETFVTPDEHMLPPDNFQETPRPVVAHRTSPTNIGLYLLSTVAARDFGWIGTAAAVDRIEQLFATMRRLPRFKGHLFNWYATQDLRPLEPQYVSSVDSGNLAGHLIAFANACGEWLDDPIAPHRAQRHARRARPGRRTAGGPRGCRGVRRRPIAGGGPGLRRHRGCVAERCGHRRHRTAHRAAVRRAGRGDGRTSGGGRHRARTRDGAARLDRRAATRGRRTRTRPRNGRRRLGGAGRTHLHPRGRSPRGRARDGLRLPRRRGSQATVHRLFALRQPARRELLRPARVGGQARQPVRDREGRRADPPLVPTRPCIGAGRRRIRARVVGRFDVRVPDAVARYARPGRQPARADHPAGRAATARIRPSAQRAVGHLRVGVQRARHRVHVSVLDVRHPRSRPQARPRRQPGRRTLRDGARGDGRSAGRPRQPGPARDVRRQRTIRVLRSRRLHAIAGP